MVHTAVFLFATNIGLVLDKYILQTTSATKKFFVDDYALPSGGLWEISTLLGYPIGMVIFGPLSDLIGRRACMITTATMTFVGALGSMAAWNIPILIACRILIGLGAGGEYPLAAVHTSEGTEKKYAARNIGFLYLSATVGTALAPLVAVALLTMFPTDPTNCPSSQCNQKNNEIIWRGTFGVAAVLALVGLILRILTTKNSNSEARRELASNTSLVLKYWKPLLSTSFSWFLYDIVEYGLKNNQVDILANSTSIEGSLWESFTTNCISIFFIFVASMCVFRFPSKWCQLFGFTVLMLLNGVIAKIYGEFDNTVFVVLYIAQSAMQAFPGVTTIGMPAEIFPAQVKGTCHGLSAMTGKLGAISGTKYFATQGNEHIIFLIVTIACALASLLTFLFSPQYTVQSLIAMEENAAQGKHSEAIKALYNHQKLGKDKEAREAGAGLSDPMTNGHKGDEEAP